MLKLSTLLLIIFLSASQASKLRIIGGTEVDASDSKWEFIVSLRYNNNHYCGGSLIAAQWVLTAAHCWHDKDGNPYSLDTQYDRIAINDYNLSQQILYPIEEIFIHPDYDPITMDNDLTLLKLTTPITGITPIILDHSSPLTAGLESWVAGWGTMTSGSADYPENLMQVMTPIIDFSTCSDFYGEYLTTNMLCAGYAEGGKDSCQGDSGGPLISDNNGEWVQSGIVSWGAGCAEPNQPGVYTKVQNYISWIESHTGTLPRSSTFKYPFLPVITNYILN